MLGEAAIRVTLRPLAVAAAEGRDVGVVEEFWLPGTNVRADLAVVASDLHGYEIKSAADTLRRLPRQVDAFGRVFDRCSAVVSGRHLDHSVELIPDWWGVIVVEEAAGLPRLVPQRPSLPNPAIDVELVVRLLWRDEVAEALLFHGTEPDLIGGRGAMWQQLLACADVESIKGTVRTSLRARHGWEGHRGRARLRLAAAPAR